MDKVEWGRLAGQMNQIKQQAKDPGKDQALKEACAGFEAIFMDKLLQSMRNTLPGNALFNESNALDIFQSMHDRHLSEQLSQSHGGMGIKAFLYNELKKSL